MAQNSHRIKKIILAVTIFLLLPSAHAKAAQNDFGPMMGQSKQQNQKRQKGAKRTRSTERKTPQQKREELIAAAGEAQKEISEKYALIIDAVNTGRQLEKPFLIETKKTVLKNRRYLAVFDNQQKCDYHTLSAWSYHFNNKQKKATDNAALAQRAVTDDHNAIATRLTLGVLYENYEAVIASLTQTAPKKKAEPKNKAEHIKQKRQQTPPGGPIKMPGMGMPGMGIGGMELQGYGRKQKSSQRTDGQFDIDPNLLRIDLLAKPFDPNIESINIANAVTDTDTNDILCVLLWKLDQTDLEKYAIVEGPNEPNEPNEVNTPTEIEQKPAKSERLPEDEVPPGTAGMFAKAKTKAKKPPQKKQPQPYPGMMGPGMMPPLMQKQMSKSQSPSDIVPKYTASTRIHPEIIDFGKMALKLDGNTNLKFMMVNINDSADSETVENYLKYNPFSLPLPAIKDFNSLDRAFIENTDNPALLIIAPDKLVKYAGTVSGFLPEATIKALLGRDELFTEPAITADPQSQAEQIKILPDAPEKPQPNEPAPPAEQPVKAAVKKPAPPDEEYFDPHAEKLIENARAFIKISNVMVQGRSYKKPIDICRQIIKNYPNTKYENQARILMRNVPKRYRKRYRITDEELGI